MFKMCKNPCFSNTLFASRLVWIEEECSLAKLLSLTYSSTFFRDSYRSTNVWEKHTFCYVYTDSHLMHAVYTATYDTARDSCRQSILLIMLLSMKFHRFLIRVTSVNVIQLCAIHLIEFLLQPSNWYRLNRITFPLYTDSKLIWLKL